jgi:hypothetical protein
MGGMVEPELAPESEPEPELEDPQSEPESELEDPESSLAG